MPSSQDEATDLRAQLRQLYEAYSGDVVSPDWLSEADRWAELVFCLLAQTAALPPELIRQAVNALQDLNLLDVTKLAAGEDHRRDTATA